MPRDYHSRAASPEYKRACDEMGWDAGLTMSRYLAEGRDDETFPEWRDRMARALDSLQEDAGG